MTNNTLTSEDLRIISLKILKKEFKGKLLDRKMDEIIEVTGERQHVLGQTFYSVSTLLKVDFDDFSNNVFKRYRWSLLFDEQEFKTKLQAFVSPYINSASAISVASGMEKTRFSRLQKGELKELYADEVYGLAKAFGLKPSELFKYFYGEGDKPVVGV